MDQCEDREEGVPPSKSSLCGEHDSQTKAQRTKKQHRPDSAGPGPGPEPGPGPGPEPKPEPKPGPGLGPGPGPGPRPRPRPRPRPGPGPGPGPSCLSFKSNESMDYFIDFKQRKSDKM
ncbi:hypothetical protein PAMA_017742 [Pampus argenteus]